MTPFAIAALLAAAAPPPPAEPTIVVTARPLDSLKRDLDACVARQCPLADDVAASLAYAEGLFVAGDYDSGARTLHASLRRNRGGAAESPERVAELYRGLANISLHQGETDWQERSTYRTAATLNHGANVALASRLTAQLDIGDLQLTRGLDGIGADGDDRLRAIRTYEDVSRKAHAAGLRQIAGFADLRRAKYYYAFGRRGKGRSIYQALMAAEGDDMAAFREGARILIARQRDPEAPPDMAALSRNAAALSPGGRQSLLWAPRAEDVVWRPVPPRKNPGSANVAPGYAHVWADVAFRVEPDGTVSDVQVLRTADNVATPWLADELKRLSGRLYTPLPPGTTSPNAERLERYSYTFAFVPGEKSRLRVRGSTPTIERLDLTPENGVGRTASR
ncbi:hypothetical protein PQ455_00940 [Sphingomonas naphthae]|uniref:TonB C-terminal domain-containing protein n=1 Tax=Sphingomonas naphthae TaxID=1813468 RepID=A0ABY7TNN6_9SPHN|nr:hypothetical protein [Sphingomonas naphthae]WCT73829.1 hypothetical protein PQ455_00940 [Sphingomonas naphthae]